MSKLPNDMKDYFSGHKLYGDEFEINDIIEWFKNEETGYADLGAKENDKYNYVYHASNWFYGFRYLRNKYFNNSLGLGSVYGDEFIPIARQIENIAIVDSSSHFVVSDIEDTSVTYFKASETGKLPFDDNAFELVTCFGVLHHIPNVSYVVSEIFRCTDYRGIVLIREPTTSMGDWRKTRKGLTKRERGIPLKIMKEIFQKTGFEIEKFSHCFFPLIPRIWKI